VEIGDLLVALELGIRGCPGLRLIGQDELVASFPDPTRSRRSPISLKVTVTSGDKSIETAVVPDLLFGIGYPDRSRPCFMVELDRGTMPVSRSDLRQTSFERKMLGYLTAYANGQHEQQFGWRTFRVLTIVPDADRLCSIVLALRKIAASAPSGPNLFLF